MEAVQPAENNGKNEAWLDTLHELYKSIPVRLLVSCTIKEHSASRKHHFLCPESVRSGPGVPNKGKHQHSMPHPDVFCYHLNAMGAQKKRPKKFL